MKRFRVFFLLLLGIFSASLFVGCSGKPQFVSGVEQNQEKEVVFRSFLEPGKPKVKKEFFLILELDSQKHRNLPDLPDLSETLQRAGLEVISKNVEPLNEIGSRKISRVKYQLLRDQNGVVTIPSIELDYTRENGEESTLKSAAIYLNFGDSASMQAPLDDIHDIEDVIEPRFQRLYSGYLLAFMALILLLSGGYLYRRFGSQAVSPRELESWEWALQEMEARNLSKLIESGNQKDFYLSLSYILRSFLSRKLNRNLSELTNQELEPLLRELEKEDADFKEGGIELLRDAEFVVYAGIDKENDLARKHWSHLKAWVQAVKKLSVERAAEGDQS